MPITSVVGGEDERPRLLPPELLPLFDDRFVATCDLHEAYVFRLALGAARASGLWDALDAPRGAAEACDRAGFPREVAPAVDWLLRELAAGGAADLVQTAGAPRAVRREATPELDPSELVAAQQELDPAALPSYRFVAAAAAIYPRFLRGEVKGDEALFAPEVVPLWGEYFDNANPLYAVNNRVAALAARTWLAGAAGPTLEVGGGLGSGAAALIEAFDEAGRAAELGPYRFTELAPFFLRRAQRRLTPLHGAKLPLTFAKFDLDAPFAPQGVEDGSLGLVFAVNTMHVARDLPAALAAVHRALRPGGWLVLGECLRPAPRVPVYSEFVFNLLEAFRAPGAAIGRPRAGGFLTAEEWEDALAAAGFAETRLYPDVKAVRAAYPGFVVGAVGARKAEEGR